MGDREGQAARMFGDTADPSSYVARAETEWALGELQERVSEQHASAWLTSPPGLGKSLLLRVLAHRLDDQWRCVYLPYAALELRDLCRWVFDRLGLEPSPGSAEQLASVARELWSEGSALVLLIDDANTMPLSAARSLGQLVRRLGGALRLVLASSDDGRTSRVQAGLALDLTEIRLRHPMGLEETREYIEARLRTADAGLRLWKRFDDRTVETIQRLSGGVPRRVHHLASEVLAGRPLRRDPLEVFEDEVHELTDADLRPLFAAIEQWDIDPSDLAPEVPEARPSLPGPQEADPAGPISEPQGMPQTGPSWSDPPGRRK